MPERYSILSSVIPDAGALAREWRTLDALGGSFFTAWPWIGTWLELIPEAASARLLRLEEGHQCRGLAIAVQHQARRHGLIRARQLHINATGRPEYDALAIEHNGLAGKDSHDCETWGALLRWFSDDAAELDELVIAGTTCRIADMGPDCGLLLHEREVDAYRVALDRVRVCGGDVGTILSANSRQQLARSRRELSTVGPLRLEAAETTEEALSFLDRLQQLHIRSWTRRGRVHGFTHPIVDPFHRKLIERLAPCRGVELLKLTAGDREFGFLYNFRRDRIVYAYQSGFDDADRRLRPGYVAHAMAIERAARQGDSIYDFMAGSNRLKQSFATERYPMYWYVFQKPLIRFKAERAARALKHIVTGERSAEARLIRPDHSRRSQ